MEYKFLSLAILIFAPILPMLLIISPLFPNNAVIVRRFAKWFAGLHFIYSLLFLLNFNPSLLSMSYPQEITFLKSGWAQTIGASISFAVDGLSLTLCVLTSFIFLLALLVSKYTINSKHKLYYSLMLLLETTLLGVFCAKDVFLFSTFWIFEAVPMYFLISLYGNKSKEKENKTNAERYLIYSVLGSVFLLFGILILYDFNFTLSGVLTANIESLSFDEFLNPIWLQIVLFVCLLLGFVSKFPVFPLYRQYTKTQTSAPMPVNIIFSGAIVNMGVYGIIRFNAQIFPTAFKQLALILMIFALINILHGAMLAYRRTNIKEIISYLHISFLGFTFLGLLTVTDIGILGAIFNIFACSLVFSGLYVVCGIIELRTKTLEIEALGGIARNMPKLMYFSLPIVFSCCITPFLIMFPSIFSIIIGTFTTELYEQTYFQLGGIIAIFALIGIVTAILRFLHNVFYGNILSQFSKIRDICLSEFFSLLMIIMPIIIFGIAPMLLTDYYVNIVAIIIDILRI